MHFNWTDTKKGHEELKDCVKDEIKKIQVMKTNKLHIFIDITFVNLYTYSLK